MTAHPTIRRFLVECAFALVLGLLASRQEGNVDAILWTVVGLGIYGAVSVLTTAILVGPRRLVEAIEEARR